ncbi:hypothetical protein A0128_09335 [Leptospira tipperaryensis]|uniref:Alginate export domain-containing protein n=1 Tax=Leptospira tipperaryensis TaxID=2564040 RepID=A0A1D7UWV3_9LEPT|nr:hypothetical protein [Leptospira tipperaryensis]AOP34025.1 hypothetical protein A0128_09335 [Leptospira tipperaryensis]
MRRVLVYSIFIIYLPLSAVDKNSGWKQISWYGWGLGAGQEKQDSSESSKERTYQELRINESLFHSSLDQNFISEHWSLKIQGDGFVSPESKFRFYSGRDLFFELKNQILSLSLGRISEEGKQSSFRDWADGTDGIVLRANFREWGKLRVDLFDFYSGYQLFEKNAFKDTILNTKRINSYSLDEIPVGNFNPEEYRNRYRGGVSYRYESSFFETGFRFQYLNFQNWGRYGDDLQIRTESSGDRDYLTHSTIDFHWKWNWFHCFLSGILARGQDKTGWNRIRNSGNIPITGEAILFSLGFENSHWKLYTFGFLPDRDRRKENGEILELGFVGIGSNPSPVFATNQSLDFYPSAWVTERGLEKQFSLQSGKRQAAWSGINFEYNKSLIRFRFFLASYFYLREDSGCSGALTLSRDSFQKGYFREVMFQTNLFFPTEDERVPLSFLKLTLGGWKSDPQTAQKEFFFQISSGVIL